MRVKRRRSVFDGSSEVPLDVWPSFADVLGTISFISFLLILLAYVRNLLNDADLRAYQERIAVAERQLNALEQRLSATATEIQAGREQLAQSHLSLQEQRDLLAVQARELGQLRSRLSGLALLRVEVLGKVKRAMEWELGSLVPRDAPVVGIGDNGNLVLNESVVFEYNSYAIKPDGGRLLVTLGNALLNVLSDPEVAENVDVIVVQGHTDERGSSAFNRELSAKRASAVLDFLFAVRPELEERYGRYFAASAYSEFRPIADGRDEPAYQQNRRIEISIVLRDANIRRVIEDYMRPASAAAAPGASAAEPSAPADGGASPAAP